MAGYNYTQYVNTIANLMPKSSGDPDFIVMLPNAIDYAEQRIYREIDLINTVTRDASNALTANNRNLTLPVPGASTTGIFITTLGFNVITPAATAPDSGTRNPLVPVTRDFLDLAWPSSTGSTLPQYYAPITQTGFIVGPWPDAAYTVEVIGTVRPAALSATNATTFLTQYLPDLFIAASMVFVSGWMRDFSSQSDDPQSAQSWENQYKTLFASANGEEVRKKYASGAWNSMPVTGATPPRN